MYSRFVRPLAFRIPPETLHHWSLAIAQRLGPPTHPPQTPDALHQTLWGLSFPNPVGLAAGFDKNAIAIPFWPRLGFGFTEVGTITAEPQPGNPTPRLFRLPLDQAVINRYGFNNDGAVAIATRLTRELQTYSSPIPLGLNLGKSKITPLSQAPLDYLTSFQTLYPHGDYFVVNVSSPNTPGLRDLQGATFLQEILRLLQAHNADQKPLLVKIAPDLTWQDLDDLLEVIHTCRVAGIIATNTTLSRQNLRTAIIPGQGTPPHQEAGGLSGPPLRERATAVIRHIWQQTQSQLPIIGVGGIDSAASAWEKISAGASLVQLYTGLVYQGPALVGQITQGLTKQLQKQGMKNLKEAIGCQQLWV